MQYQGDKVISSCFYYFKQRQLDDINQKVYQFHHLLPVFIFPDAKPFNQILGALEFRVKAIFLPFESGHILHGHAEKDETKTNIPEVTAAFGYFKISEKVCNLNGKERFSPAFGPVLCCPQRRFKAKISLHRAPCYLAPEYRCRGATKNVTSKLIQANGLSAMSPLKQWWRHSACMWHIQAETREKWGKHTPTRHQGLFICWHHQMIAKTLMLIGLTSREKLRLLVKLQNSVIYKH